MIGSWPARAVATLFLLAGCSAAAPGAPPRPTEPTRPPPPLTCGDDGRTRATSRAEAPADAPVPYGLTISGGLSIGSFEAGAAWALVRALKAHRVGTGRKLGRAPADLAMSTGASAGNINAFLAAAAWCQRDEIPDSVEDNPFARAWLDVGIERLLPGWVSCEDFRDSFDPGLTCRPDEQAYSEDDGAFARRALAAPERMVQALLQAKGRFIPGCTVPVAVTVTSEEVQAFRSGDIDRQGARGIRVPSQRESVFFRAEGHADGLRMRQWLTAVDPTFGHTLYVAREPDGVVSPETLLDVIEASSAFPIAFGMKSLSVCTPLRGDDPRECEPGHAGRWTSARYFDGGLYDNVPLGLSMYMAEPPGLCRRGDDAWVHREGVRYLFLDPATTRLRGPHVVTPQPRKAGVPLLLDLLGRFVNVARKYELQTSLRHLLGARKGSAVDAVTRLVPIMSAHANDFAGFFARPFRQYDYFVGVYEGLHAAADQACEELGSDPAQRPREHVQCLAGQLVRLHDLLGLDAPTAHTRTASYVVRRLFRHEAEVRLSSVAEAEAVLAATAVPGAPSAGAWCDQGSTGDEITRLLLDENIRLDRDLRDPSKPWRAIGMEDFERLLAAVRGPVKRKMAAEEGAPPPAALLDYRINLSEAQLFTDFDTWAWHRAARLAERLAYVAERSGDATSRSIFGAVNFVVHEIEKPEPGWIDVNATTMSSCRICGARWARAFPYEATVPRTGGLEVGYRFNAYAGPHLGLTVPLRPWSFTDADGRHFGKVGLGPLWVTGSDIVFSSVELAFNAELAYKLGAGGERSTWALELGTTHVFRHIRVSASFENLAWKGPLPDNPLDHLVFRFGLADMSSLLYWLAR